MFLSRWWIIYFVSNNVMIGVAAICCRNELPRFGREDRSAGCRLLCFVFGGCRCQEARKQVKRVI